MATVSLQALYEAWDYCMQNPSTEAGYQDVYLRIMRMVTGDENYVLTEANRKLLKAALYAKAYSPQSFNAGPTTGRTSANRPVYQYAGPERRTHEFAKLRSILNERKAMAVDADYTELELRVLSSMNGDRNGNV